MRKFKYLVFALLIVQIMISCSREPDIDDATMLDGDQIFDISLLHPDSCLISAYMPSPTEQQLNTPVIIAAHGYSACTFEWKELRRYADSAGTFYVSQVLLGGHGRTYEEFKNSSWEDWQYSIKEEYIKLSNLGFKKIYLAGSSAGAALTINLVSSGFFDSYNPPKGIFLIDPIIISSNKTLTLVQAVGPLLGFATTEVEGGEQGYWYCYRPQQTLKQLMNLIDLDRTELEKGIVLPMNTYMKVYKSKYDETADAVSALLIYKGMKTSTGGNIDVELFDSHLHVFTRLAGRSNVTPQDVQLQQQVFREMENIMIR